MAFPGRTNVYDDNDIRCVIPEANDPIIKLWAPQLKNDSFWLVGASRVSRVKISALADDVSICKGQETITGTASENYERVETLGKIRIFAYERFYIEAYVTRSTNMAPYVVDGIFGLDDIEARNWQFKNYAGGLKCLDDRILRVPFIRRETSIPDYLEKLRDRLSTSRKAKETADAWGIASKRLKQMRPLLPPALAREDDPTIINMLDEYSDCFYLPGDKLKPTKLITYRIKSTETEIIHFQQPHYSKDQWDLIESYIEDLLRQEIIRKSFSLYNFAMGLMEKKPDCRGNINYRVMVDYGKLNARSEAELFPIPSIYDIADELNGSKYFSVLDLASAAYQVPLEPKDYSKTAFTTRSGHYEYQRMPFMIKNGAEYLQRLMMKVVEGLRDRVAVYHDDLLIHAPTIEDYEIAVERVLARVRQHGLKLNPGKCQMFSDSVLYLGYLVTSRGLLPDPAKIDKLMPQQRPNTADDLKSHLGLLSTHKRFLPDYASKSKPMWNLLKESIFGWTCEAAKCYEDFQEILSQELLLQYPNWDRPFIVKTGSSKYGIWASLLQKRTRNAKPRPIAHESRVYTPAEERSDDNQRNFQASVYGMETFRRYVEKSTTPPTALAQKLKING